MWALATLALRCLFLLASQGRMQNHWAFALCGHLGLGFEPLAGHDNAQTASAPTVICRLGRLGTREGGRPAIGSTTIATGMELLVKHGRGNPDDRGMKDAWARTFQENWCCVGVARSDL
jgi:hypothetical protein